MLSSNRLIRPIHHMEKQLYYVKIFPTISWLKETQNQTFEVLVIGLVIFTTPIMWFLLQSDIIFETSVFRLSIL